VILVNPDDSTCQYLDFGRYHTPFGTGRVRNARTDADLHIGTKARISNGRLINLEQILLEVMRNRASHASGPVLASWVRLDHAKALRKADMLAERSPLPYGPFAPKSLNCTRFVRTVILSGRPPMPVFLRMAKVPTFTPTARFTVLALPHWKKMPESLNVVQDECLVRRICPVTDLGSVLPALERPSEVPVEAQWVSGETSGSWFHVVPMADHFVLNRYCPEGRMECSTRLIALEKGFVLLPDHRIVPLSTCSQLTIEQSDSQWKLVGQ